MARDVGIGMLGAGFIGQMHSLSFGAAAHARPAPRVRARLVALAEQDRALAEDIQDRYGWESIHQDWREVTGHPDIALFVNAGPNDAHVAPSIAAAEAGKHIFSEKPLAATADEAHALWKAVDGAGVLHMCAFVHRFIPALRLAREMIRAGEIGEVRHFRSNFLLYMLNPDGGVSWRFSRAVAGGGSTGDLGSHHIDQARYLVGEVARVGAITRTWSKDATGRIGDLNDDWFGAVAELENGATAMFEATRITPGHALTGRIEVDGSKGSLAFEMERLNELRVLEPGRGPRTVFVTKPEHPYCDFWLPVGIQGAHPLAWQDCFAHQAHHMLLAVQHGQSVGPHGATFEDGYRVAEIVDTILHSAESGRFEDVTFRTL